MYEFSYINAANSSLKEIKEAREHLLQLLKSQMGDFDPDNSEIENAYLKQKNERLNQNFQADSNEQVDKQSNENSDEEFGEQISIDELTPDDSESEPNKQLQIEVDNMSPYEIDRLQVYINLYYYIKHGFNVVIEVDKMKDENIKLSHIESLIRKSIALNLPLNIFISGYSKIGGEKEHVDMLFNQKLLNTFIALNNYLRSNGVADLRFMEDPLYPDNSWTLSEVINANEEINSLVDTIKMQNFSPYEAMAYIHYYLTSQFPYKESAEDPLTPRSIVGLLNSENIVCVGYAKFIKAVVDKLNMPGLSAQTIESVIKPIYPKHGAKMVNQYPISGFAHLQNLITIKDTKYGIKGTYMNDACWDAKNDEFITGKGFGNFMYSVNDAFKYNSFSFQQISSRDSYDATKILQSQKIMRKEEMPFYQKYSKQSKTIPIETFEICIYNMFKKIFPSLSVKQVREKTNFYCLLSKVVASSVFSEQAESELALEGREIQKYTQKVIDDKQIVK